MMPHVQGEKQQQRKACQEPPIGQPGHRNSWGWCCWLPFALEDCLTCATHEHTLSTLEQVETLRVMPAPLYSKYKSLLYSEVLFMKLVQEADQCWIGNLQSFQR